MEEQKDMQNQAQDNMSEGSQQSQESSQSQAEPQQPVREESTQQAEQPQPTQQQGTAGSSTDNGKLWGVIGYIIPILFFIPLVMDDLKSNPYSKFHANQQLVLLISWIVVNVVGGILPIIGWFIILPIGTLILIILTIIGIINGAQGNQKPLPMIGGITILK